METTKQIVKTGQVTLRRVEWVDFPLFVAWRNLPHVYETMVENPYPPSEEEVANWMGSYLDDAGAEYGILWVVEVSGIPVGYGLARDFKSGVPEVGIIIADRDYWMAGVAKEAARLGYEILRGLGFGKVQAVTRNENTRIDGFLKSDGYQQISSDSQIKRWLKEL